MVYSASLRLLMVLVLVAACGTRSPAPAPTQPPPAATVAPAPTLSSDPLDQAVIAFDGQHSRAEIKAALDAAFAIYGLQPSDENYSRAGSTLVALRQQAVAKGCTRCSEMEILAAMTAGGDGFAGLTFPQAAAWAVTVLEVG